MPERTQACCWINLRRGGQVGWSPSRSSRIDGVATDIVQAEWIALRLLSNAAGPFAALTSRFGAAGDSSDRSPCVSLRHETLVWIDERR